MNAQQKIQVEMLYLMYVYVIYITFVDNVG